MKQEYKSDPSRWDVAQRSFRCDVEYACAVERHVHPRGYGWLWWIAVAVVSAVSFYLIVTGSPS